MWIIFVGKPSAPSFLTQTLLFRSSCISNDFSRLIPARKVDNGDYEEVLTSPSKRGVKSGILQNQAIILSEKLIHEHCGRISFLVPPPATTAEHYHNVGDSARKHIAAGQRSAAGNK